MSNILKNYTIPAVYKVWQDEQAARLQEIEAEPIVIASDMRVDSPGHTEVKNSNAMELKSLKRQSNYLEDRDIQVTKLVTDCHTQVSAFMANEKHGIEHSYDVWHVAKGSAAYKKLEEMLTKPRLITAIRKLSQYHQTSGLEAKHALDNTLASKNTYHSYHSLSARLYCSNLHFNENSNRKQATTSEGKLRWTIAYPKAFKGEKAVAKPLKEKPTYGYVQLILKETIQLRKQYPTIKKAKDHANKVLPTEPATLVEKYLVGKERPSKEEVITSRKSRFSTPALPTSQAEQRLSTKPCSCKGKCATKKCNCKATDILCDNRCKCMASKCKNRDAD
ncbi:uncharacterized protein LOC114534789 [Dendronephthya gigantea]|uniref:uncharacterized protein LOC114534789 n=1 Tax=Dendronephthya gigantea TaxID=151771 RepID=UPI00106BF5F7|nr:uncharacterized protein LOC114534789 [Dendronephthya gigantea]